MIRSRIRLFAALLAASAGPALAQDPAAETPEAAEASETTRVDAAVAFAERLTADASAALTSDANEAEQIAAFQAVLADGLALETIGKFMIGGARSEMSEAQLARFDAVFPDYITKLYAEQFDDIAGKPLTVNDARELGARDVIVRTQFERAGDSPINVDWRIRRLKSGEQKAIDIIVQGVSIMLVKREEFASFIQSNGVDALLDRLEQEAAA